MSDARELNRLRSGPELDERSGALRIVDLVARCPGNADAVLGRSREVMEAVLAYNADNWPSSSQWQALLPAWFIEKCAPEMSLEEAERALQSWRQLSPDEQIEAERRASWSVPDWLYWMHPDERQWSWWDANVNGPNELLVAIAVNEWPFAWGALEWLLRASGAREVIAENDDPAA